MEIILNGEPYLIGENRSIVDLVHLLNLVPERLAIELNLDILPKSAWGETLLKPGDRVEMVHFVGGG
ncbi:MAG: sulfur carrier protein ThiS [Acidobacteria bacterium]|nr:sulfur carrier protein ThiS [Acidobacteriota bacterium]MBK8313189.1 sulfur carrier protein ThiS [Acidobacteriota bacterium]